MVNVKKEVKDNKLILTVDLLQEHGRSKSGKTIIVATTNGFVWEDRKADRYDAFGYSLNVVKK